MAEMTTYNGELGEVADWERDLGIVGGLSSLITPLMAFDEPIVPVSYTHLTLPTIYSV